jgi:hypothetical protein
MPARPKVLSCERCAFQTRDRGGLLFVGKGETVSKKVVKEGIAGEFQRILLE